MQSGLGIARSTLYRALEYDSALAAATGPVEASVDRATHPSLPPRWRPPISARRGWRFSCRASSQIWLW
ncbi:hypothetical protein [Nonomuraea helvata]|uniref:Helix-turn-helix domain-containing protein n=1 Tax=Nonomuraea helvata TaxID=37484 RepID=A0ABV5S6W8_9ACTN